MLATLTDKRNFNVRLVDENVEKLDVRKRVDIACLSIITESACRGYRIADFFQEQNTAVVFGGIHASALPEEALQHGDSVVIGECEEIWNTVLRDFLEGKLKRVYRQQQPTDLSKIPPTEFGFCDKKYLLSNLIQTTRGCPHRCRFCSVTEYYGKEIRHRPIPNVVEEIILMKKRSSGFAQPWFFVVDDNLVADPAYTKELLTALIPLKIKVFAQSSVFIADDRELLSLAYRAGVRVLYIGFESLDQTLLNRFSKPNKSKEYQRQLRTILDHRIAVIGSFLLDLERLPPDRYAPVLRFSLRNVQMVQFHSVVPYPGTALYERNREHQNTTKMQRGHEKEQSIKRANKMLILSFHREFYSWPHLLRRTARLRVELRSSWKSMAWYLFLNWYLHRQVARIPASATKDVTPSGCPELNHSSFSLQGCSTLRRD